MKTLGLTGFALIVLALDLASPVKGQGAAASTSTSTSTAVRERVWNVAGLTAPADIVIDHWGIAHIFAASTRDTASKPRADLSPDRFLRDLRRLGAPGDGCGSVGQFSGD